MIAKVLESQTEASKKDFWRTPAWLLALLARRYGPFAVDVAANSMNALCPVWFGPGSPLGCAYEDALAVSWRLDGGLYRAFCNPPYSRGMVARFVFKAAEEAALGHARTTLPVPVSADQGWWHGAVWDNAAGRPYPGVEVYFPQGRIRFLRPDGSVAGSPDFASAVITFGGWSGQRAA